MNILKLVIQLSWIFSERCISGDLKSAKKLFDENDEELEELEDIFKKNMQERTY